jgi:PTH1 family peptidyl-tRNA hydrolase
VGAPRLIVGLGNPGREYERTRHNAGFLAAERLAVTFNLTSPVRFKSSQIVRGQVAGEKVVVAWPQTFMNLSGQAVRELAAFYKTPGRDILILHDEMDLAPGRLKMSFGGGLAGHKGLTSILALLREDFCRLKIGVGRPPAEFFSGGSADYVLGRFTDQEWTRVDEALTRAARAAAAWVELGLVMAQNQINRRDQEPGDQDS